ncbi:MAG: hypothetical protein Q9166_004097 [cf. Caloplaca sp. 2 TL-2023]
MSYSVSALSPAPLREQLMQPNYQLPMRIKYHYPDFKPATPSKSKDQAYLNSVQLYNAATDLDRAFSAARKAFQLEEADKPDQSAQPTSGKTTESPSKRKAEAADLNDHLDDTKKQKTLFIDFESQQQQKKKPGRPPKEVTQKPKKVVTGFRKNVPVKAQIPEDIWCTIFEHSSLSTLLTLKDVSRQQRDLLLNNSTIWTTARRNAYGLDHPNPPPGVSEQQYADLLVGSGCQAKGCQDKRTKKVYWAFQRRWCGPCMKKNVVLDTGCQRVLEKYPNISDCITGAGFDQFGKYTCVPGYAENEEPAWFKPGVVEKIGYLRSDVHKMCQEFDAAEQMISLDKHGIEEARQAWVAEKREANDEVVRKLQAIENWTITCKIGRREEAEGRRQGRRPGRAAASTLYLLSAPPLDREILDPMRNLHNSLVSGNSIHEEDWEHLEDQVRAQQEHPVRCSANTEETMDQPSRRDHSDYQVLASAREERPPYESARVRSIGCCIVEDMIEDAAHHTMAFSDLVRIALMRTYEAMQAEMANMNHKPLLMDDARLVYRQILEKVNPAMRQEPTGMKCPGCKKGRVKPYDFLDLIVHIFNNHADDMTGDFKHFYVSRSELPVGVDFPWCFVEWPRNLPILAVGQDSRGTWDLYEEGEEHPRPTYGTNPFPHGLGAFDGRVAATSIGAPSSDFVENVLYATLQLEDSKIQDEFKTQMALEYAVQRFEFVQHARPGTEVLEPLAVGLLRHGVLGLFEGFRCQKCCEIFWREGKKGYFVRSAKPFWELCDHFMKAHKGKDWTREMLDLPTPQDLLAELQSNKPTYSIFEMLFPTEMNLTLDPQLRQPTIAGAVDEETDEEEEEAEDEGED